MGKGSPKQQVSEYYMSIHSGLCIGPLDAVTGLFVGEKLAWEGEVTDEAPIYINAPSLFGGNKDGGGVGGIMYYLPGDADQVMPDALAARHGLNGNTSPAYRGVASVYFIGLDGVPTGSIDTSGSTGGDGGTSGGGGGAGGGVGGDGSGSSGCPVYTARVLLANDARDGPGKPTMACLIVAGRDYVWTRHETTGQWGAFPVTRHTLLSAQLYETPGRPHTSGSHLWLDGDDWVRADAIGRRLGAQNTVVSMTVEDAHTYVLIGDDGRRWISHNKPPVTPGDD